MKQVNILRRTIAFLYFDLVQESLASRPFIKKKKLKMIRVLVSITRSNTRLKKRRDAACRCTSTCTTDANA